MQGQADARPLPDSDNGNQEGMPEEDDVFIAFPKIIRLIIRVLQSHQASHFSRPLATDEVRDFAGNRSEFPRMQRVTVVQGLRFSFSFAAKVPAKLKVR